MDLSAVQAPGPREPHDQPEDRLAEHQERCGHQGPLVRDAPHADNGTLRERPVIRPSWRLRPRLTADAFPVQPHPYGSQAQGPGRHRQQARTCAEVPHPRTRKSALKQTPGGLSSRPTRKKPASDATRLFAKALSSQKKTLPNKADLFHFQPVIQSSIKFVSFDRRIMES